MNLYEPLVEYISVLGWLQTFLLCNLILSIDSRIDRDKIAGTLRNMKDYKKCFLLPSTSLILLPRGSTIISPVCFQISMHM